MKPSPLFAGKNLLNITLWMNMYALGKSKHFIEYLIKQNGKLSLNRDVNSIISNIEDVSA